QLRAQPADYPITDLRGLAAVIAHRTCSRWMRRQFPERHAFKNRVYYLMTRQRGFSLWRGDNDKLIAGFAAWQGQKHTATPEQLSQLPDRDPLIASIGSSTAKKQSEGLAEGLASIFNHVGPVEFDTLISFVAELLKIRDQPIDSTDQNEIAIGLAASTHEAGTEWAAEKRIFLQRLWEELLHLPLTQR